MKNKFWSVLYCALFFAVILVPTALMPWADNTTAENRPLAPAPELIIDGKLNLEAPVQTEEFFKDRFAGRAQMIDAYSRLVGGVFGVSANDKVILGRDGWLFFAETLGDFQGSSRPDDTQTTQLIDYLSQLKQEAEQRGQVFIIAVAPNKNTLYGEHMPGLYRASDEPSNLEHLLAEAQLECIDVGAVLHAAAQETKQPIYLKTDSHWNAAGARAVAREIMSVIEDKTGVAADFDWEAGDGVLQNIEITGDLAGMLYPRNPPTERDFYFPDTQQRYETVGRFRTLDDMHITTRSDGAPLKIAMYRDSFAISLIPYFSNAYSDVYYTRQTPPPFTREEFTQADVIIFQIVERRLGELVAG